MFFYPIEYHKKFSSKIRPCWSQNKPTNKNSEVSTGPNFVHPWALAPKVTFVLQIKEEKKSFHCTCKNIPTGNN